MRGIGAGHRQARLLVGLLSAAISGVGAAQPEPGLEAAASAARRTLDDWVAMWNRYDLAQVDQLFVADSTVTYFSSEREGLIRGIDSLRRHHESFGFVSGGKDQPNRLRLHDLQVSTHGDAVIATAVWQFIRGDGTTQRGPVTFVLVRRGDQYRIAHANFGTYGT